MVGVTQCATRTGHTIQIGTTTTVVGTAAVVTETVIPLAEADPEADPEVAPAAEAAQVVGPRVAGVVAVAIITLPLRRIPLPQRIQVEAAARAAATEKHLRLAGHRN